jgi:hypothetical protein
MPTKPYAVLGARLVVLVVMLASACSAPAAAPTPLPATATPEWFDMELIDVVTGESFTVNDYAGKVILLETMAMWCPNCLVQAWEVKQLRERLGPRDDFVTITLDVDVNEDAASLKEYVERDSLTGHYAIAPLLVARALGNLYTAQYLNPPLSPMMIIDRNGEVHHLKYGRKDAAFLLEQVQEYLQQ